MQEAQAVTGESANSLCSQHLKQTLAIINEHRASRNEQPIAGFKPKQEECVLGGGQGSDLMAILSTGYGKSLLFEAIPIYRALVQGCTQKKSIIISPLNAIIEQQMKTLSPAALRVTVLDNASSESSDDSGSEGGRETEENNDLSGLLRRGDFKYLIGHPEDFLTKKSMSLMRKAKWVKDVSTIFVDEAHVCVQWSTGFRDQYKDIENLRAIFPHAQFVALTATASLKMRAEIKRILNMKSPMTVSTEVDRTNMFYSVQRRPSSRAVEDSYTSVFVPLMKELKSMGGTYPKTIVYTSLKWCGFGNEVGVKIIADGQVSIAGVPEVAQFHAPLSPEVKNSVAEEMASPDSTLRLLLATEAFGMGVDTPDVRRVIHAGPPCTLETYVQTTGRGGRDGLPCKATVFYNNEDVSKQIVTEDMRKYIALESCRRTYLCEHFGTAKAFCGEKHECCDNCCKVCKCAGCESNSNHCHTVPEPAVEASQNSRMITVALRKVFKAVNQGLKMPMDPQLFTGLTPWLALDVGNNYHHFVNEQFIGAQDLMSVNYYHLKPKYTKLLHDVIIGYLRMAARSSLSQV